MSSQLLYNPDVEDNGLLPRAEASNNQQEVLEQQHFLSLSFDENNTSTEKDVEGGSLHRKLKHNAKERIRRLKLNASYLSLQSLLPKCRRSKVKLNNFSYWNNTIKIFFFTLWLFDHRYANVEDQRLKTLYESYWNNIPVRYLSLHFVWQTEV